MLHQSTKQAIKRAKILLTRKFPDVIETELSKNFDVTRNENDTAYDAQQLVALAQGHDAILTSPTEKFDAVLLNNLPNSIQIISTFSVGFDHIDIAAANTRNILITNTPDAVTNATADITFLCILGAARRAQNAEHVLRQGQWDRWGPTSLLGTEVTGKRLGIIGMGGIGRAVAKRAQGFDMEIHYHNRHPVSEALGFNAIYHKDLKSLLENSDILSINCPLTPDTHYLINKETLAYLPNQAVLVNTARGPILKDEDVIAALKNGKLSAVGLDVFEGEPHHIHPEYFELDNAFLLPHIGTATEETRNEMGFKSIKNLSAYFAGQNIPNIVGKMNNKAAFERNSNC